MDTRTLLKIINFYARFTPNYTKIGYIARSLGWRRMPPLDFSGQRWLVTGASSGLGKAMMHAAANANAEVVGVSSNQGKLDAAVAELNEAAAARVTTIAADLSLQSSTQVLLDRLLARGERFDVLQNNAGMLLNEMSLTSEGRESTFAINVLSHYLLTSGLVENGGFNQDAVVVNMTSGGMYNAPLGIKGLNNTDESTYNGKASYAYSKRAQVALTDYWNERYGDRGIRFYVTHPGWSRTPGVQEALPIFWKIQYLILRTPRQGVDTALWLCATRPTVEEDVVWFDRKSRVTHMYDYTKKPQCTLQELADYFETELAGS
ncbi:MAG: short chain dehydrogenase/reductase family oxidoreductase [Woeseia sp.]|nr:short chain dehydrogenase/reductase family oxidoreductase [Woeseia sp.]|tara:strand:+ start:400 stop:1356 length:957 start_codon:yes stop_codon:yes gene_type:complete